ncbi:hypothetical protein [Mycobacterium seoulense]|uniref:hypothetical protein n=1 Tax=Mycobacterium seoulense TaxID=386911 RepID=UPI003CF7A3E5
MADLRTHVALAAWANTGIRTKLKDDPRGAVTEIADRHSQWIFRMSISSPNVNFKVVIGEPGDYTLVVPESPVGKSPAEIRAMRS